MKTQYLMPMARNTVTKQVVKSQDLTGARLSMQQHDHAQIKADRLAVTMTEQTNQHWVGFVRAYTI
jgi:hypothetical protein